MFTVSFLSRRVIVCRATSLLVFCCIPIFAAVLLLENGMRMKPSWPRKLNRRRDGPEVYQ